MRLFMRKKRKGGNYMEDGISRKEHEEFARRQDEENHRQNRRIAELEESVRQIGALTISVEKLASSMESMVKEQEKQGTRLEILEARDGEKWRKAMAYIGTAILGAVLAIVFAKIGL